ncbi:hypothetical protein KSD_36790 [Ktedonobacter sp. SOSP1-85]|nr:hypothetical protein KSD_36790 [Ktedonobacter sp. SOSP1-85]
MLVLRVWENSSLVASSEEKGAKEKKQRFTLMLSGSLHRDEFVGLTFSHKEGSAPFALWKVL